MSSFEYTSYRQQSSKSPSSALPSLTTPNATTSNDGSLRTARSHLANDFSRIPAYSSIQRNDGSHSTSNISRTRAGLGQLDAGAAPDAAPRVDAGSTTEPTHSPEQTPSAREEPTETPDSQDQPAEGEECSIESETAVHAPDRTPDTRTTIGVCETVLFRIGGQVADWTSSSGWPQSRTARARYEWAAPEREGTSTITATVPATGQRCSIDMKVIAPESIRYRNVNELNYPLGEAGAGMQLTVHLRPRNVNFGWVATREDDVDAAGIGGYFTQFTAAQLRHAATPNFARIGWDNGLAPDAAGNPQGDTAATVQGTLPQPWSEGTYRWSIPVRYRCSNSTHNGHIFTRAQQRFAMENDGTMIVTKGGARVERTP